MGRLAAAIAVGVAVALASVHLAHADATAADKASAEALFSEGKRLMEAGQYAAACPKLADSQKLDPGVGTLLNLGVCYERAGLTASAWATFKEAARAAHDAGESQREAFARDHAAALEPKLAKLSVSVAPASAVQGLQVTRDGEPVPQSSWGLGLPVDPGDHELAATAPGRAPWSTKVTVTPGGAATVEVPPLAPSAEPGPAATAPPQPAAPASAPAAAGGAPDRGEHPEASSSQRTIAVVVGGVGLAGIIGSVVAGVVAKGQYDATLRPSGGDARCSVGGACTPQGRDAQQSAQSLANAGTWIFVGGAALVATGVVLFLTSPSHGGASVALAPAPGGALIRGAW